MTKGGRGEGGLFFLNMIELEFHCKNNNSKLKFPTKGKTPREGKRRPSDKRRPVVTVIIFPFEEVTEDMREKKGELDKMFGVHAARGFHRADSSQQREKKKKIMKDVIHSDLHSADLLKSSGDQGGARAQVRRAREQE